MGACPTSRDLWQFTLLEHRDIATRGLTAALTSMPAFGLLEPLAFRRAAQTYEADMQYDIPTPQLVTCDADPC
jgi:hypothetical protein